MASLVRRGSTYYAAWRKNGCQSRKSLKTSNKRIAERRLREFERQLSDGEFTQVRDISVDTFWSLFKPHLEIHYSSFTVEAYQRHWSRLLQEFQPATLEDVRRGDIEKLKSRWLKSGAKPRTINGFIRHGKAIFNHARNLSLGPDGKALYSGDNPFVGVKFLKETGEEKKTLTRGQLKELLSAATEHGQGNIQLVFALAGYAGLRKREILAARWEWIDWDRKTISVYQGDGFTTKNSKGRMLPLHSELRAVLEPHRRDSGYIYKPLAVNKPGKRYRYTKLDHYFNRVAQELNFHDAAGESIHVTPHTLRHTFGTLLLKGGALIANISQWMGHSSIQVTVDVYGHLQGHHADIEKL